MADLTELKTTLDQAERQLTRLDDQRASAQQEIESTEAAIREIGFDLATLDDELAKVQADAEEAAEYTIRELNTLLREAGLESGN
jgi:chromosome segregation ATPase